MVEVVGSSPIGITIYEYLHRLRPVFFYAKNSFPRLSRIRLKWGFGQIQTFTALSYNAREKAVFKVVGSYELQQYSADAFVDRNNIATRCGVLRKIHFVIKRIGQACGGIAETVEHMDVGF